MLPRKTSRAPRRPPALTLQRAMWGTLRPKISGRCHPVEGGLPPDLSFVALLAPSPVEGAKEEAPWCFPEATKAKAPVCQGPTSPACAHASARYVGHPSPENLRPMPPRRRWLATRSSLALSRATRAKGGGGDGIRTHDPLHAMQVLSQLSYSPTLGREGRTGEQETGASPVLLPASRVPRPSALLVGAAGFEPAASWPPSRRSTKLSYAPCRPSLLPTLPQASRSPAVNAMLHGIAAAELRPELARLRRPSGPLGPFQGPRGAPEMRLWRIQEFGR